tara:strand:- start:10792 stop:11247 length:456 start_codon:yes stop_codon:yes gene_type:complete
MASRERFWEDFIVGERYSTSTRTITEADQDHFCKLVGYDVPLFLDDSQAPDPPYAGRICPSHLIMSVATAMTGRLFSSSLLGLLGIDNGKFMEPVHPGDTLSTKVEVIEKRLTSKAGRGIIIFRDHVFNQHGVEVFKVDKITLIRCREAKT